MGVLWFGVIARAFVLRREVDVPSAERPSADVGAALAEGGMPIPPNR
jgi:hypothetical protein